MSRASSFRSFSLRALLLLVTAAAVAAYSDRPEARVLAAFAAIVHDNPDAQIVFWRVDDELAVFAAGVRRMSPRTARLVVRANMIRFLSLSPRDTDGLLRSIEDRSEACAVLRTGFDRLGPGLTIECFRRFEATDLFSGKSATWRPGAALPTGSQASISRP